MVHAMYLSLGMKYDLRSELKYVNAPVLVIHGDMDVFSARSSLEYAELFPHGEFKKIFGAGHFPFSEKPKEFAELVRKFLTK